jgi:hypothetical protein
MLMRDWKERYRSSTANWAADTRLYVQVRPSSGLRYPRLELDKWYPVRRQDDLGCFIEIGNAEMYLERGHYVCREGRRGSDKPEIPVASAERASPARAT